MKLFNDWKIVLLLCGTVGLAPFVPEPHIWGKLKWIAGGAAGMSATDWFDIILHGLPWVLMIRILFIRVKNKK